MNGTLLARKARVVRGAHTILDALDFELEPGTCTAILGPNGAGKSTLLSLLAGDFAPSHGRVRLCGSAPHRLAVPLLAARRAVLTQQHALDYPFSVDRVVELGLPGATRALRGLILDELGIAELSQRRYTMLSGGEARLVQVARVLLQADALEAPGWLMLDEPEAHLDLGVAHRVLNAASRRSRAGRGVVAVLHDVQLAARWADHVLVLAGGRLLAQGPPSEVLTARLLTKAWGTPLTVERTTRGLHIAP